jgi:hypothetical protein
MVCNSPESGRIAGELEIPGELEFAKSPDYSPEVSRWAGELQHV